MKAIYVNPFIQATYHLFTDYLGVEVSNEPPYLNTQPQQLLAVSAIIGLAGETKGAVVLSFGRNTAIKVSSRFTGKEIDGLTKDVIDCIGETVNIVAGNAKKDLRYCRLSISLPGVIVGNSYKINWPTGTPVITIPFISEYGPFSVNVSLRE